MMKIMISKKNIADKIYFLLMFVAIYCSHDTLLFGTNGNNNFILLRKIIPFILVVCLAAFGNWKVPSPKQIIVAVCFIAFPFFSAIFNGEPLENYIYRATIILCALMFVWTARENEFQVNFNKIMYFFSIWSVCTFVLANVFPSLVTIFPVISNTKGVPFHYMLFSSVTYNYSYGLMRNFCIFREPGMFAIFLAVAFLFELVFTKKPNIKHIIVYTIAMASTLSTAGYIILGCLYLYMFASSSKFKFKYVLIVGFVFLVLLNLDAGIFSSDSALWSKFTEGSNNYGSWLSRLVGVTKNWEIALQNPLFGLGRYALYDVVLAKEGVYRVMDNTNTMMINFAAYGLLYGFVNGVGVFLFLHRHNKKILMTIFGFLILFTAFSNEDMGQNILYYYIVLTGLVSYEVKKKKKWEIDWQQPAVLDVQESRISAE